MGSNETLLATNDWQTYYGSIDGAEGPVTSTIYIQSVSASRLRVIATMPRVYQMFVYSILDYVKDFVLEMLDTFVEHKCDPSLTTTGQFSFPYWDLLLVSDHLQTDPNAQLVLDLSQVSSECSQGCPGGGVEVKFLSDQLISGARLSIN